MIAAPTETESNFHNIMLAQKHMLLRSQNGCCCSEITSVAKEGRIWKREMKLLFLRGLLCGISSEHNNSS